MMFLDCPAYLDDDGVARCGLPAEVRCSYAMQSSDGPLDSAMIRCPSGHYFNGPVEFLTWKNGEGQDARWSLDCGPGSDALAPCDHPGLRALAISQSKFYELVHKGAAQQ
jgi:hypothetical protein